MALPPDPGGDFATGDRAEAAERGVVVVLIAFGVLNELLTDTAPVRLAGADAGLDARSLMLPLFAPSGELPAKPRSPVGDLGTPLDAAEYIRCFEVFPVASSFLASCELLALV